MLALVAEKTAASSGRPRGAGSSPATRRIRGTCWGDRYAELEQLPGGAGVAHAVSGRGADELGGCLLTGGRPRCGGDAPFARTSSRCQRSSVCGVTSSP